METDRNELICGWTERMVGIGPFKWWLVLTYARYDSSIRRVVRQVIRDARIIHPDIEQKPELFRVRLARQSIWNEQEGMFGYESIGDLCWEATVKLMAYSESEFQPSDKLWLSWPERKLGVFNTWIPAGKVVFAESEEKATQFVDESGIKNSWMINILGFDFLEL